MKRFLFVPLFAALVAATGPAPQVETATGDWRELPALQQRGYEHLQPNVMAYLFKIASNGRCALPGYYPRHLDLNMPFAVQYRPDGGVARVILPKLNCPEAEGVLGGALVDMLQGGDFRASGENPEGWYQSNLTFDFEG